jgi:hypothetical protein
VLSIRTIGAAVVGAAAIGLSNVGVQSAQALQLFDFSYSGTGITASGQFTTNDLDPITNRYAITGVTGQRNGSLITGPVALGTDPSFIYNNQLLLNAPFFDFGGVLFNVASLGNVNLYFDGSVMRDATRSTGVGSDFNPGREVSLTLTPIPTPALLPGLVGLGIAAMRKRQNKQSEQVAKTAEV